MKYLHKFKKFQLLLEKIKKDSDYYAAREDLHKPADFLVQRLKTLSDKAGKSGGGQSKEEFERKARDTFYDIFNEAIGFLPDDQEAVRTKLDSLVVVSKKYPRMSSSSEYYFLILNLTDKSSKNVTSKDDTIMVGNEYHRFSENSSYSFKLSVREDFVNTRSTKFEKLFITGIKDTIDRITAIKIIESFTSFYFSKIVPKDPQREKVRELLKKGKTVEQIAKITKLSKEEVEKLIVRVELQNEYEMEEKETEETDLETKPTEPEFADSESKNIFIWDKMIEEFRSAGKGVLKNNELEERIIIDFDITVDKFKKAIFENKYEFRNFKGDYKQAICQTLLNAIHSEKETRFNNLLNPKNVESVYYLIFVCKRMMGGVMGKEFNPKIIELVTEYNVNLGLLFRFNEIVNGLKNKGISILSEKGDSLIDDFLSTVDKLFLVMVEDKFNTVKEIEDSTQLSKFLIEKLYSKNYGLFKKVFRVENIESVQTLMLVCNVINGNTNFRENKISKSIIDLASKHDVNLGMLLSLDRKKSYILGKALGILYKEKMHDLESKLTEAFDDLFKRMIEDNFSNATILNNPKDFSLFIFDEKMDKQIDSILRSPLQTQFDSFLLVYVCAKMSGAEKIGYIAKSKLEEIKKISP